MAIDLKNKVVLITGASSGFGEDAARLFAREGCKVVLAARRLDRLQALAAEIQNAGGEALAIPVDISQPAEIEVMVQTALDLYERIDILFNNAGYGSMDWFENLILNVVLKLSSRLISLEPCLSRVPFCRTCLNMVRDILLICHQ